MVHETNCFTFRKNLLNEGVKISRMEGQKYGVITCGDSYLPINNNCPPVMVDELVFAGQVDIGLLPRRPRFKLLGERQKLGSYIVHFNLAGHDKLFGNFNFLIANRHDTSSLVQVSAGEELQVWFGSGAITKLRFSETTVSRCEVDMVAAAAARVERMEQHFYRQWPDCNIEGRRRGIVWAAFRQWDSYYKSSEEAGDIYLDFLTKGDVRPYVSKECELTLWRHLFQKRDRRHILLLNSVDDVVDTLKVPRGRRRRRVVAKVAAT